MVEPTQPKQNNEQPERYSLVQGNKRGPQIKVALDLDLANVQQILSLTG